uniref:Uncharacterized protein n=1 Tax=Anopheles coluzzii TaxID=1518534 RepID=A0A8W7P3Y6_ANOCL
MAYPVRTHCLATLQLIQRFPQRVPLAQQCLLLPLHHRQLALQLIVLKLGPHRLAHLLVQHAVQVLYLLLVQLYLPLQPGVLLRFLLVFEILLQIVGAPFLLQLDLFLQIIVVLQLLLVRLQLRFADFQLLVRLLQDVDLVLELRDLGRRRVQLIDLYLQLADLLLLYHRLHLQVVPGRFRLQQLILQAVDQLAQVVVARRTELYRPERRSVVADQVRVFVPSHDGLQLHDLLLQGRLFLYQPEHLFVRFVTLLGQRIPVLLQRFHVQARGGRVDRVARRRRTLPDVLDVLQGGHYVPLQRLLQLHDLRDVLLLFQTVHRTAEYELQQPAELVRVTLFRDFQRVRAQLLRQVQAQLVLIVHVDAFDDFPQIAHLQPPVRADVRLDLGQPAVGEHFRRDLVERLGEGRPVRQLLHRAVRGGQVQLAEPAYQRFVDFHFIVFHPCAYGYPGGASGRGNGSVGGYTVSAGRNLVLESRKRGHKNFPPTYAYAPGN